MFMEEIQNRYKLDCQPLDGILKAMDLDLHDRGRNYGERRGHIWTLRPFSSEEN